MTDDTQTPNKEAEEAGEAKETPQVSLNELEDEPSSLDNSQAETSSASSDDLAAVYDVPVQVSAVLGRTTMQVNQLLKMGRGAVIELDRKVGEAIDVYVNNRLVARGEVVVVDDHLGITMTEIIKADKGAA